MPADADALFTRIPQLEGLRPEDFSITALPGYTNRNLRLVGAENDWVLRIPRASTNRYIDREAEAHNQALAAALGIAPQALWRDASGTSLTPTLSSCRGLRADDFCDAGTLRAVLAPLRRLHRSGAEFQGRVNLDELLSRYFALLKPPLQARFEQRLREARRLLPLLEARDLPRVASHNDLILENLLIRDRRVWLIDWEFSAMASPYWDLATLCNSAQLDHAQSLRLLDAYCSGAEPMEESPLFDYRDLLQLLGDCWMAALVE
jgi:thiamine kinase-like enzyme